MYDICIVGAGPCGLVSALNLCKKYKVCILEAGREYDKIIFLAFKPLMCYNT